jgi:FAD/FMN-containing dehydrogenase
MSIVVNDIHSKLNSTAMRAVYRPSTIEELQRVLKTESGPFTIAGERHAMGSQQFLTGGCLIDTRSLTKVRDFNYETGQITVEAGITWPALQAAYENLQTTLGGIRWGFAQKQTGADDLTLGGAVAANIHGRGLRMAPFVQDILEFELLCPDGSVIACSRSANRELFSLGIGGYGMFGVVTAVTLQLTPRQVLRRTVRILDIEDAIPAAQRRISEGYLYGDFQFDIDPDSPDFLTKGVFSGYYPVPESLPSTATNELSDDAWRELLYLAHTDKRKAFQLYAQHYISTDGQLYLSDTHQRSTYLVDYHSSLDTRLESACPGSEMISELYVPPERLLDFLKSAATFLVKQETPVIYGTIRLIERDSETFLPWAKERYACIIFNLHVDHTAIGITKVRAAFQGLIDLALERGGSFFLTYHRFARADQLLQAYPQLPEFVAAKMRFDPNMRFRSTWFDWIVASVQGDGSKYSQ